MLQFNLAARNLLRNPVRSAVTLGALCFGVVALLLSGGFIEWIFWAMREATVYSRLGHIQIARRGSLIEGQPDSGTVTLSDHAPELALVRASSGVRLVASRLNFSGLISHGETTVPFIGEGVEAESERQISRLLHVVDGRDLSSADTHGIILGQGLAATLGVKIGAPVVLLTTRAGGGINAVEGRVRGLFFTVSKRYDDSALRVPIALARDLLRVSGSHTWIVLLERTEDTQRVLAQVKRQLLPTSSALEIRPWNDLADFYNKTVALYSRQMNILKLIIALIIVFGIANTMTMNVLERTGEIGTLMALGNTASKILGLFLTEGLLLGLIGGCAGVFIGSLLAMLISFVGIPMPPAPGMSTGFSGEIRLTWNLQFTALSMAVLAALLASAYPAWRASRLNIVDALRHNR